MAASRTAPENNPLERYFTHGFLSEKVDLARVALHELLLRDKAGRLSVEYRRQIDEMCLANLGLPITTPVQYYLDEELSDRLQAGKLTSAQVAKIHNTITVSISCPPTVMQWNRVPLDVKINENHPRGSSNRRSFEIIYKSVRIDGKEYDWAFDPSLRDRSRFELAALLRSGLHCTVPGSHRLELDVQIDIHDGSIRAPYQNTVIHSESRTLTASFIEIEPRLLAKVIRFINDPEHEAGHYESIKLLTYQILNAHVSLRNLALTEMIRRGRLSQLSTEDNARFIDQLLAIQKDRSTPWDESFGDYIEYQRLVGKLSDSRWRQYGNEQLNFFMRSKSQICLDDPLQIEIVRLARGGSALASPLSASHYNVNVTLDSESSRRHFVRLDASLPWVPQSGPEYARLLISRHPGIQLGPHTLRGRITYYYNSNWTEFPKGLVIPTEFDIGETTFTVIPRKPEHAK